jgi:hypothetical protein
VLVAIENDKWEGIFRGDTIDLIKRIQQLGLRVETIAGAYGRVAMIKDLTEAVRNAGH